MAKNVNYSKLSRLKYFMELLFTKKDAKIQLDAFSTIKGLRIPTAHRLCHIIYEIVTVQIQKLKIIMIMMRRLNKN